MRSLRNNAVSPFRAKSKKQAERQVEKRMGTGQNVAFYMRSGPESRGLVVDNKARGIINHKTRRASADEPV